jgi:hypothetical protein
LRGPQGATLLVLEQTNSTLWLWGGWNLGAQCADEWRSALVGYGREWISEPERTACNVQEGKNWKGKSSKYLASGEHGIVRRRHVVNVGRVGRGSACWRAAEGGLELEEAVGR